MEKLDIVIIGAVAVAGVWYFRDLSNRPPPQPNVAAPSSISVGTPTTASGGAPVATPPPPPVQAAANPRKEKLRFRTPEHEVLLSSQGASVSEVTFSNIQESTYRAVQSGDDDDRKAAPFRVLQPLHDPRTPVRSFVVAPLAAQPTDVAKELEQASQVDWAHEELAGGTGHRFSLQLPSGLRLVKTYEAPPQTPADDKAEKGPPAYHFRLTLTIENPTGQTQQLGWLLGGPVGMVDQASDRSRSGQQAFATSRRLEKVREMQVLPVLGLEEWKGVTAGDATIGAFGLATKYFAAVVIPDRAPSLAKAEAIGLLPAFRSAPTDADKLEDGLAHQGLVVAHAPAREIGPGARTETYDIYIGPKSKQIFESDAPPVAKQGLDKLIDFGWFESLAVLMLAVLRFFKSVALGNWGIAIILLTFLVRGLLLPLSIWSQKNMLRMQKVAPELNKLKEKYSKKDGTMTPEQQRAFAQAQMDLFRTHGVNPVGCLGPIFLQIPVFVGLWNALNYSYDLREQPFFGWIQDLSVPDVLFRIPGITLPLLGTNAFSVLPLIMVACYYLQMKLQPTPTDPRAAEQQKMMMFMMPIFGLLMYTAPSGLMVYFITSAVWTMVESKWVKKHLERTEGPLPAVAVPVVPGA